MATMSVLSSEDRLHLCGKVSKLDGKVLNDILQIINDVEPNALSYVNDQWVFDMATIRDETLLRIRALLESRFGRRFMQKQNNYGNDANMNKTDISNIGATLNNNTNINNNTNYGVAEPGPEQSWMGNTPNPLPGKYENIPSSYTSTPSNNWNMGNETELMKPEPAIIPHKQNPNAPDFGKGDRSLKRERPRTVEEEEPIKKQDTTTLKRKARKKKPAPRQEENKKTPEELHAMGFFESFEVSGFQIFVGKDDTGTTKRLICGECGKIFRGRSEVIVHVRVHTGEKPLACQYCEKTFAHPSNLKVHERGHRGEKPYVCEYPGCNRRFAHSMSLKDHTYKHTGLYPHKCELCSKGFRSRTYLAKHMKSHAKKKAKAEAAALALAQKKKKR